MFRILSLAGGGLRGAYAIGFIAALEQRLGEGLWNYFDLIAGTSTGSITASALCRGTDGNGLQAFYEKHAAAIFHPRPPRTPRFAVRWAYPIARWYARRRIDQNLDHFFGSRYCPSALEASMVEGFGDDRLADATLSRLIIPCANLTDGRTCVFRTPHLPIERDEYRWKIKDIILAACAAPTYFPHKEMPDGKCYADGGLWAIDPGVVALSEAARIIRRENGDGDWPEDKAQFASERVHLLSLGTGRSSYSLSPPGADAGLLFWARHVADVMSLMQVQGTHLPLKIVLGDRYRHYDFELKDPSWSMDCVAMTDELFDIGRRAGDEAFDDLKPVFLAEHAARYRACNRRCDDPRTINL